MSLGMLPACWQRHGSEALNDLRAKYPLVFGEEGKIPVQNYSGPPSYHVGQFTDAWGCVWENIREGYESIVTGHPLADRDMIHTYRAPEKDDGIPHGFMFLRITDLRGFEEAMIDFAEEPPELQMLIDIIRDYNVKMTRRKCEREKGFLVGFGDDNGMQDSLPIRPSIWRKYLKPAYTAIFQTAKEMGKTVFFHTDGCIWEVMPDMHEAGADIINPQIRANGLDNLERVCKGKIPISLDLDRQLFPFATPEQIKKHVYECVERLYLPQGGLALQAECAADVPLENIEAICQAMSEVTYYRG